MPKNKLKERLLEVFTNWIDWAEDCNCLEDIKCAIDDVLDDWHSDDAFGTEGQCDPRGDARDLDRKPKI